MTVLRTIRHAGAEITYSTAGSLIAYALVLRWLGRALHRERLRVLANFSADLRSTISRTLDSDGSPFGKAGDRKGER